MKTGRFGGQPERSVFPVWVLTGFACCSASKSRSTHAVFRGCLKTIFQNRSKQPLLSKAINLSYALLHGERSYSGVWDGGERYLILYVAVLK